MGKRTAQYALERVVGVGFDICWDRITALYSKKFDFIL